MIPAKQQEILDTETPTPVSRIPFEGVAVVTREARERSSGRKSREQVSTTKRPFINNAARIESGLDVTPGESEQSKSVRDGILSSMLGYHGLLDYAKLSGKHRDKPGEIELEALEDVQLVDAETKFFP